jgi:hypothetical protein
MTRLIGAPSCEKCKNVYYVGPEHMECRLNPPTVFLVPGQQGVQAVSVFPGVTPAMVCRKYEHLVVLPD